GGGPRVPGDLDVVAPAASRDGLPRRLAARDLAPGDPESARRVPDPDVHGRDGEWRNARRAPEDVPAQPRSQALVRDGAWGRAARDGDRGLHRAVAAPAGHRPLPRIPPHELRPGPRA